MGTVTPRDADCTPRASASRRAAAAIAVSCVGAAVIAVAWPLLAADGWPQTHEAARYLVLMDRFASAVAGGDPYPRYLVDLYGGYGYPIFCFYQPGLFFLSAPMVWLAPDVLTAARALVLVLLLLGALGAWRLARELAGPWVAALAPAWFLLTPYVCVNLYVRGDLSELMGMMLGPWVVLAVLRLHRGTERGDGAVAAAVGLTVALAALVVAHPAPTLGMAPCLAALVVVLAVSSRRRVAFLGRASGATLAAAALTAPYWWTLLQLRPHVAFERLASAYFSPELHLLSPWQLVSTRWGFGGSEVPPATDDMSFQLGALHLLVAIVGALAGRRSWIARWAFACWVLLVALMLTPAEPFWRYAGVARFLQFPWRLLSVTATLQLVLAVSAVGVRSSREAVAHGPSGAIDRRWALAAVVVLAIGVFVHREQFRIQGVAGTDGLVVAYRDPSRTAQFKMMGGVGEYVPKAVSRRPPQPRDRTAPPLTLLGPGTVTWEGPPDPARPRCRVEVPGPAAVRLERPYLPEWDVRVDGERLTREAVEDGLSPHGFPRILLPAAGVYEVSAAYDGPPGRRLRDAISASIVVLLGVALLRAARRRRAAPASESGAASSSR